MRLSFSIYRSHGYDRPSMMLGVMADGVVDDELEDSRRMKTSAAFCAAAAQPARAAARPMVSFIVAVGRRSCCEVGWSTLGESLRNVTS